MESHAFGVYIGNSTCTVGVCKDGKADVIASENGERLTPAFVGYQESVEVVGRPAFQRTIRFPKSCTAGIPRVLGLSLDEAIKAGTAKSMVTCGKDSSTMFMLQDGETTQQIYAADLLTALAKQLYTTAKSSGSEQYSAVPVVPMSYTEQRSTLVRRVYERAGFTVKRVIRSAPAALLAYNVGQESSDDASLLCAVVRVGGSGTEVSVVRAVSGIYQCLATAEHLGCGGDALTYQLMQYLSSDFSRKFRGAAVESGSRGWRRLQQAATSAKHVLATLPTATCSVDSLHEGLDYHASITRPRFDNLLGEVLQQIQTLCRSVCNDASVNISEISKVVLCGGGCKTVSVQKAISDVFPSAQVLSSIPADEVLARGAAVQCALLSAYDDTQLLKHLDCVDAECLPHQICIKVWSGESESEAVTLLPAYCTAPARRHRTLQLPAGATSSAQLHVSQADQLLAEMLLEDIPSTARAIDVHAHLRRDGSLHLTAKELTTDHATEVLIEAS